ncbi:MAG: ferritin-like domain-containing protein, partial [Sphingomonas sp.]
MIDRETLLEVFDIAERRRNERRRFIKMAGTAVAATAGASLLAACDNDDDKSVPVTPTPSPTPTAGLPAGDVDVLNFALNLEYLEANYYTFAAFGSGLNTTLQAGTGTQGSVTGGAQVLFQDATVAAYAREIAADENLHVTFLRQQLGSSAVAMPAINIDGGANGAFTAAARAAGVVGATGTFNPYASDENWLLGGMLLSDVGVTAYKGSASLI